MNTPHKHAEQIKAWADGAEIDFRRIGDALWIPIDDPVWGEDCEFRIRPDLYRENYYTYDLIDGMIFAQRRGPGDLKLTINRCTGEIKSAEIL